MKNKEKKMAAQKMCREDAGFWTKLRNEPYLRTHPKMLAVNLIGGIILQYFLYLILFIVFAYVWTSVNGALGVI